MAFKLFKRKEKPMKLTELHERVEELKQAIATFNELEGVTDEGTRKYCEQMLPECELLLSELAKAQTVNDKELADAHDRLVGGWWATAEMNGRELRIYEKRKAYFDDAQVQLSEAKAKFEKYVPKKTEESSESQPNNG